MVSLNAKTGLSRILEMKSRNNQGSHGNPSKVKSCLAMRAAKRGLPRSSKSSSITGRILPARTFPMFATRVSNAETGFSLRWSTSSEIAGQILSSRLTPISPLVWPKSKAWLMVPTSLLTSATHGALATTSTLSTTRLERSKMRLLARLAVSGIPFKSSTRKKARSWRTVPSTSKSTANGTTILRTTKSSSTKLKVDTSEHLG